MTPVRMFLRWAGRTVILAVATVAGCEMVFVTIWWIGVVSGGSAGVVAALIALYATAFIFVLSAVLRKRIVR